MYSAISASIIYPVSAAPLINGVLILDDDGVIISVLSAEEAQFQGIDHIEFFEGALIPGLVNTHCHLELSHLLQQLPEHTGLPAFLQKVIFYPQTEDALVLEAMKQADLAMYSNGIVAVGDISNKLISKAVKLESKIHYHTFVEILGFTPQNAASIMKRGEELRYAFEPLSASVSPHAPYSVSQELFAEIKRYSTGTANLISMHNQETADEGLFYEKKEGAFLKFYEALGVDIDFFTAGGKSSLQTVLPQLPEGRVLLVHNTLTNALDIAFATDAAQEIFWCLCPNANLYIENRFPPVEMMREAGLKITLGTDSLASNHQLSILSEMFTLQELETPAVDFEDLVLWGTLNGAEFLGIQEQYGSFEPGKKPGVNLIQGMNGAKLTASSTIKRLI